MLFCSPLVLAQTEAERAYEEARQAFADAQFDEARELLQTAVQTDAKNPDILLLLGKSHYQLGQVDEAISAWRRLLAVAPQHEYAKRMVGTLTDQLKDATTRLATARRLLDQNLLESALAEVSRLDRIESLSDADRASVHLLVGECYVLKGEIARALERFAHLATEYPDVANEARPRALLAFAQLAQAADDTAAVATCEALVQNQPDSEAAAIADLALQLNGIRSDERAIKPILEWLKNHPTGPWAELTRSRLLSAIRNLPAVASGSARIDSDSPLADTDAQAIRLAAEVSLLLPKHELGEALVRDLLTHIVSKYEPHGAFDAIATAIDTFEGVELRLKETRLLAQARTQLAEQRAAAQLKEILVDPSSGLLVAWISKNAEHPSLVQAQRNLLSVYLKETTATGKPDANAPLAPNIAKAIELVGAMIAEIEKPAEATALVQVPLQFLATHYTNSGAHEAAIAGTKQLLELDAPSDIRPALLKALVQAQLDASLSELNQLAKGGKIESGPLPGRLAEAIATCATLRQEFPSEGGWVLQAKVAAAVHALEAQVPWPAIVSQPKPPQAWAMEVALPVAGSNDDAASKQARQVIVQVAQQCAAVNQRESRGLPAKIYNRLLAVLDTEDSAWSEVLLQRVAYLRATAQVEFQENAIAGRDSTNDELSASTKAAIQDLATLLAARPAKADTVMAQLHQLLAPWADSSRYELVVTTFEQFGDGVPAQTKRAIDLHIARLQRTQVVRRDSRMLKAGVKPVERLDPLMQQALVTCYALQGDVADADPIASQAYGLRREILSYYARLGYDDVVATAIQVAADPAVDRIDAQAELDLARHKLAIARRETNRLLREHDGRKRLAITNELQAAIDAITGFLQKRPEHELTRIAETELLGIAKRFESHQRYDIAVALYGDIEQFALGVDPLVTRAQGQPHLAERAALAAADALTADAKNVLRKQLRERDDVSAPSELSQEFKAAIEAYRHIVADYSEGPLLESALAGTKGIARHYAEIDAWDVADSVYANLQELDLTFQRPERLAFARAVCTVGKVMPEHARELLKVISEDASGFFDQSEVMLALETGRSLNGRMRREDMARLLADNGVTGWRSTGNESGEVSPPAVNAPDEPEAERPADMPVVSQPVPAADSIAMNDSEPQSSASGPSPGFGGFGGGGLPADDFAAAEELDEAAAQREATLLAAVQRRQATMASRVAQMRDRQFQFVQTDVQETPAIAVLSAAELKRQEEVIDAAYLALRAIMADYDHTPTASQARGEILVLVNHWREITKWKRAADLVTRFLDDHPQDREYPKLRTESARDLLAWAAAGVGKNQTKQQTLETLSQRFQTARDALDDIVQEFEDNDSIQRQAQWDIAASFLTQARVVAALSPTLARGQFVRSADELLVVSEQYHDHPRIKSIPQMLWQISQELVSRGFYDEAIAVWTSISVHYPLDPLARQAAMQTAQTYQNKLGQPLRAVETYVEHYYATGASDAAIQNTVFQIAMKLKQEKRWIEALHVLETFTNAFPTHPQAGQALSSIGDIHQTNEVWEDAIIAYQRVIDEYGNSDWVKEGRWSIAACKINRSEWEDAITAYREFAAAYSDDSRVPEATRRVEVLKNLARYQRVVDEKNQPKAFDAQYQIGSIVNSQLSNPVKAIIEFRKVAANWPKDHLADDALFQVGSLELNRGNTIDARDALLDVAEKYPNSPLADDALFLVGRSYENEVQKFVGVTRSKSEALANDIAQKFAYRQSQAARRLNRERGQAVLSELKQAGKFAEADKEVANFAGRNSAFDQAVVEVIANQAKQQAETLTAEQMADRQDKINAALRKAVDVYGRASKLVSGDKADDALLRMADIYDRQLKDEEEAMIVWKAIVKQFGGTSVAEDSSWKIAQYYERKKQFDEAIDAYQNFLRSYRNSGRAGDAMIGVAENYEKLDRWVDAMDWYTNYTGKYPQGTHMQRAKEQIAWIKTYRL